MCTPSATDSLCKKEADTLSAMWFAQPVLQLSSENARHKPSTMADGLSPCAIVRLLSDEVVF
jgi:hypothetical protein